MMNQTTVGIGILGGAFDPIHLGHLGIARQLKEVFALPSVYLIPTGQSTHRNPPTIPANQRLELARLAVSHEVGLLVDDREIRRKGFCYTIDTLSELQVIYPEATLTWLIGADALLSFTRWHRWQALLDKGHLVVAARPGFDINCLEPGLANEVSARITPALPTHIERGRVSFLPSLFLPFSSTEIRARLKMGLPVDTMTPVANELKSFWYTPTKGVFTKLCPSCK